MRNELADAIVDLSALIDEIRFSGAFAAVLIEDYEHSVAADGDREESSSADSQELRSLGIPVAALALLTPFFAPVPAPHDLFTEPHMRFAGDRVLSLWFAGQLIDSSLFRIVAAVDRVAIILWVSASLPIPVSKSTSHPAFRPGYLRRLTPHYSDHTVSALIQLTDHQLFRLIMSVRNGFAHSKRVLSELHGHYRVAYEAADPRGIVTQAIDGRTHLAILLACYNEILRPAIDNAAKCLGAP